MKTVITTIFSLILFGVILIGGSFLGLWHYQFFAPKMENARREVFQKTRSYNEAKIQDLVKYRMEYLREKDPVSKSALRSTILLMFADYPTEQLPRELRYFIQELRDV